MLRRLWQPDVLGPNVFSTSHAQPLAPRIEPYALQGYYLDMRVKAVSPSWPASWFEPGGRSLWVGVAQAGLGFHERYIRGEGDQWLDAAIAVGDQLVGEQETEGVHRGAWVHRTPYPHTYHLPPPWVSAMAQGEAASLLVRLARIMSDERYGYAAREAMRPMRRPSARGGVLAPLDGGPFFEEYPTDPPSFVLNGGIFALWGCHDVAVGLDDETAGELFEEGCDALASNLDRYDLGYWSRYDLFPHRIVNISSLAYHQLHTDQLRATAVVGGRSAFDDMATRFAEYRESAINVARATAQKVAFRLLVPRRHGS